jgi:hypothetical protein
LLFCSQVHVYLFPSDIIFFLKKNVQQISSKRKAALHSPKTLDTN